MRFTLKEFSFLTASKHFGSAMIDSISFDSRNVKKGTLFVAIRGKNSDGFDWVKDAIRNGASAILTTTSNYSKAKEIIAKGFPIAFAENPLLSIHKMLEIKKKEINNLLSIGITGSCGKTTTKEMLSSILAQRNSCVSTIGNLNSEYGLAISMMQLKKDTAYCVFECGIDHIGEMDSMVKTLDPDIAIITNISNSHLEAFGSMDITAREKSKILSLGAKGFMLKDCEWSSIIQKSYPNLYRAAYAFDSVKDLGLDGCEVSFNNKKFTIPVIGKAKLLDASLAISVASYLGFEDEEIISGLKSVNTLFGRSRLVKESGLEIIEDCYNANLPSSIDAIRTISSINTKGNKHVVLADMRELGCESVPSHKRLAQELSCADVDDILLYGNEVKATYNTLIELGLKDKVFYTPDFNTLCEETKKRAKKGDIVLLKGSRVMALERLYPTLREVC